MTNKKFKVYLKSYKLLVDVIRINFDVKTIECYLVNKEEGDPSEFDFKEINLLQYTEIKDCENNELYDQDIVEFKINSFQTTKCLISYDSKEFCGWIIANEDMGKDKALPIGKYGAKISEIKRIGSNLELKLFK